VTRKFVGVFRPDRRQRRKRKKSEVVILIRGEIGRWPYQSSVTYVACACEEGNIKFGSEPKTLVRVTRRVQGVYKTDFFGKPATNGRLTWPPRPGLGRAVWFLASDGECCGGDIDTVKWPPGSGLVPTIDWTTAWRRTRHGPRDFSRRRGVKSEMTWRAALRTGKSKKPNVVRINAPALNATVYTTLLCIRV